MNGLLVVHFFGLQHKCTHIGHNHQIITAVNAHLMYVENFQNLWVAGGLLVLATIDLVDLSLWSETMFV